MAEPKFTRGVDWLCSPAGERYLREEDLRLAKELRTLRAELAKELWDRRAKWPHRLEMRDHANAVLWPLFCRLGIKNCASCFHKKIP